MNKRIKLYRENHVSKDGRVLLNTQWASTPIPVLLAADNSIIGSISNLRFDKKTGWCTGTLKTPATLTGLAAQADFDSLDDVEHIGDEMIFRGARLRAVHLGERPVWDEMVI